MKHLVLEEQDISTVKKKENKMARKPKKSPAFPTTSNRGRKKAPVEQDAKELNELNKDANTKASTLNAIGSVAQNALKNVTGLLANIAAYGSYEKVDFDKNGNQIVSGTSKEQLKYRSSANIDENGDIAQAIAEQKASLKEAREKPTEWKNPFSEEDILRIVEETNDALQKRIFGPLWKNWTTGEDFLAAIKYALETLIDTYDPLMSIVDELQDYVDKSTSGLADVSVEFGSVNKNSNRNTSLPLGIMAIEALNVIIEYIRELVRNIEMIAEVYTTEEINVLVRKGGGDSNWGTIIKSLQDLVQLIVNCLKPYLHNLVMALILDAIDLIVDKLDKAGILSPSGPLKLIPTAITLVRAILRGDLEAIEEMVKKTLIKMTNILQLAIAANPVTGDPSILWDDTDTLDKKIAIARYEELTKDGEFSDADKDKFFNYTTETSSAAVRHFLQKMKGETAEQFNEVADFASTYSDLNVLYKKAVSAFSEQKKNTNKINAELETANAEIEAMNQSIERESKEEDLP